MLSSISIKKRIKIYTLVVIMLVAFFGYKMYNYWPQINSNNKDIVKLKKDYEKLLDENEILASNVIKLKDPDYIARYAREKYLYSKDGEIIIKIIEDKKKE